MKKEYTTVLDAGCESLSTMLVSAGKIGHQIEISPKDLAAIVKATFASIVHEA